VNVVCGQHNRDEIAGVLDFAEARGVGSVSLINVFQNPAVAGRFQEDCRVHALSAEESQELLAFVEDRRKSSSGLVVRTLNFVSRGCETCEAGRSIVYVDAEGRILPCTLTDNSGFAQLTAGLTIAEALAVFRDAVPDLPASSCAPALRASADLSRGKAGAWGSRS
jgi:MoaA/NifB/PqqE/SkfB family radical SAM enzyme